MPPVPPVEGAGAAEADPFEIALTGEATPAAGVVTGRAAELVGPDFGEDAAEPPVVPFHVIVGRLVRAGGVAGAAVDPTVADGVAPGLPGLTPIAETVPSALTDAV